MLQLPTVVRSRGRLRLGLRKRLTATSPPNPLKLSAMIRRRAIAFSLDLPMMGSRNLGLISNFLIEHGDLQWPQ